MQETLVDQSSKLIQTYKDKFETEPLLIKIPVGIISIS